MYYQLSVMEETRIVNFMYIVLTSDHIVNNVEKQANAITSILDGFLGFPHHML